MYQGGADLPDTADDFNTTLRIVKRFTLAKNAFQYDIQVAYTTTVIEVFSDNNANRANWRLYKGTYNQNEYY